MNFKSLFIAALSSVVLFAGCTKEESTDSLKTLQVSPKTYISISPSGSTESVTITSTVNWTVTSEIPDWLTLSATSGSANQTVTLSFTAAKCDYGRQAEIQISAGVHTQFLTVRQGEMTVETVTCKESMTGTAGKTYRVKGAVTSITSTTYGNMYLDDGSGTEAYIYGTLDANGAEKNFSSLGIEVGDVVTVEGPLSFYGTTAELVNVTVIKIEKSLLKIDNSAVSAPAAGTEFTVKAAYKGSGVFASIPDDASSWLSLKKMDYKAGVATKIVKSPADTAILTFAVAANTAGPRDATITLSSASGSNSSNCTVAVSQMGCSGTIETPFTVAEAIQYCMTLPSKTPTTTKFYIKGKVSKFVSKGEFGATYGNGSFWISDDGVYNNDLSKDFEAYRVLWLGNKKWAEGNTALSVGDEVILCATVQNYGGTAETGSGYVYKVNGHDAEAKGIAIANPLSIAEAVALCKTLDNKAVTDGKYCVSGIVSKLTNYNYGASYNTASFWLSDDGTTSGDQFEAYTVYYKNNSGLSSSVKFPEDGVAIAVGQKIVLLGNLSIYNGTCETASKKAYIVSQE